MITRKIFFLWIFLLFAFQSASIPKQIQELAFGLKRKLSRFDDKKSSCIIILRHFLSSNPEALAQPKYQFLSLFGYTNLEPAEFEFFSPGSVDRISAPPVEKIISNSAARSLQTHTQSLCVYRNNLKNRFLTSSALPHNFCFRSCLALGNGHSLQTKNSDWLPCQIPDSSDCFGIHITSFRAQEIRRKILLY